MFSEIVSEQDEMRESMVVGNTGDVADLGTVNNDTKSEEEVEAKNEPNTNQVSQIRLV